jgi:hypothetical protein
MRDLSKKRITVTLEVPEVEGGEVGESLEELRKKREGLVKDCKREFTTVGYREKLFRNHGERW